MTNYQIITDSGCDLPLEMQQQLDVNMVSLTLQFRGKELQDSVGEDITSLYEGLRAGEVASTSAVNPDTWSGIMEAALQAGKDALVMAFSSGLSTTYQSAVMAS